MTDIDEHFIILMETSLNETIEAARKYLESVPKERQEIEKARIQGFADGYNKARILAFAHVFNMHPIIIKELDEN